MRPGLLTLAALACAGAAFAQEAVTLSPEPPPGYPPKMGEIRGTLGEKPAAWFTYDFSIGAFDASAWASESDGKVKLRMRGLTPGEPGSERNALWITVSYDAGFTSGAAPGPVEVVLYRRQDRRDGARMEAAPGAVFVVDSVAPRAPDSYSQRLTGRVEARLCPKEWLLRGCEDLVVRFDTDVQIDSRLELR